MKRAKTGLGNPPDEPVGIVSIFYISGMITLHRVAGTDPVFLQLTTLLDQDLALRDGPDHAFYAPFNATAAIRHAVVANADGGPAGCGAFKPYDDHTAEIKRMYVLPDQRGKGIAAIVLKELENWCRELGYTACQLETGKNQPEAIRLYQKTSYRQIDCYGQYKNIANSICFAKSLALQ